MRYAARVKKVLAPCLFAAVSFLAAASLAMPLQSIIESAKPCVAHLALLDEQGEEEAHGTGFVVSDDGVIVTNFHVADGADRIVATFADDRKVGVVGAWVFDPDVDLAVLQLAPGNYPKLALAPSEPKQGDEVVVIGSPRGLAGSVSTGIVSAIRKEGAVPLGDAKRAHGSGVESWALQITAPISPGSSGSPVLDAEGRVVGVAVGQVTGQSLNFAVPAAKLRDLLAKIPTGGRPNPIVAVRKGRSVARNLLISVAGLGGAALVAWIVSVLARRRGRSERRLQ
jgi:S1-C subfamily serine protease